MTLRRDRTMVEASVVEQLLRRTAEELVRRRHRPESTYRLQFHAGFRFRDAAAVAGYLADLGVSDCYASPYLKARPGSQHGYDITDHRQLNAEIGSEEDYQAFVAALKARGLGQVLDVVPNHMGIIGNENAWWNDVLENGRASAFAAFFDIDWHSAKPDLHDKVLLPILGDPYGKALEALQLRLHFDGGAFSVHYFDHHFPVAPCTYADILRLRLGELEHELGKDSYDLIEYQSILTAISHLPPHNTSDPAATAERRREKEVIKRRLVGLTTSSAPVRAFIEANVRIFNGQPTPGTDANGAPVDSRSFDLLDDLLQAQPYRLAWWRVASDEINYRRFFDVNELAALSMEKSEVFAAAHELVLCLLGDDAVQGLRIDHPDGLFDPGEYLHGLQQHYAVQVACKIASADPAFAGIGWADVKEPLAEAIRQESLRPGSPFRRPLYVVVEKILGPDEPLPENWPVDGTTGYEFLNVLNGLFVDRDHAAAFTRLYRKWTHRDDSFRDLVYQKKFLILQVSLSSELNMLAVQLDRLSEKNRWSRDFTLNSLRRALREVIACFEVYRPYITGTVVSERDRRYVEKAVEQAKRRNPAVSDALFDFVRDMLLDHNKHLLAADRAEQRRFVGKFQQVTSPVMAKGLEDTAFYVFNRLVSLNEVGGDPRQFGTSLHTFHRRNAERQARFPHALSATATHDTKRGEDTRARLDVLSEIPKIWQQALTRWSRWNKKHKSRRDDELLPDRNEEYFFYQTLVGAWPLGTPGPAEKARFRERLHAYVQKAMHEAKVHTSWINPNPGFDEAVRAFVAGVLDERRNHRFLEDFQHFQRRIDHYAFFNSLSQLLLKVASPGAADIYQGTELWDFSLVDPDNRRPVDYALRRRLLSELQARIAAGEEGLTGLCRELIEHREDARVKMYVLTRALHCRRDHPGLFSEGEYLPAHAEADRNENVCAFVRRFQRHSALVAAPRLLTRRIELGQLPLGEACWGQTRLNLPEAVGGRVWYNIFTGQTFRSIEHEDLSCLRLAELFAHFPVALLLSKDEG
jgi:(1->4)-alpha-D-glucan 1-alpha-D-glucosylmutase